MTVAFVLQGGASLAAVQVGMLRALTETGIRPDLVVGSSAGALNAVAFAQDPTSNGLDQLRQLWIRARRGDVFPLCPLSLTAGLTGFRDSLTEPDRLRALIESGLRIHDLQDTTIPTHVVATDTHTGSPAVLSEGPAVDALLASASIPGILPPVERNGQLLVDGSLSADIPILQAEALGATTTYVLPSLLTPTPHPRAAGALPILIRTVAMLLGRTSASDLAAARGKVHVVPTPQVRRGLNPLDFRHAAEQIRLGHDTTRNWLADHTASPGPQRLNDVPRLPTRNPVRGTNRGCVVTPRRVDEDWT
ncbi:patatin-like phospholipase family protein [Streptomyces ureilyticus]|uniref:Patatin-like phospholipase family protein n=1 Tax=Streptomyces ureilyticus TaxID=1775131 RepID=A0ABX0DT88_9ACTN|nr:patatin-like phospholipase family protein [Streptomyces ureilyticus]NGO45117.1 patatin-like phospholipase family protein [Streptomyces ureilyticus]